MAYFPTQADLYLLIQQELPEVVYPHSGRPAEYLSTTDSAAQAQMIRKLYEHYQTAYDNQWPQTANAAGIELHEVARFGQASNGLDLTERQNRVLARMRALPSMSRPDLRGSFASYLPSPATSRPQTDAIIAAITANGITPASTEIRVEFKSWNQEGSKWRLGVSLLGVDTILGGGMRAPHDVDVCKLTAAQLGLTSDQLLDMRRNAYTFEVNVYDGDIVESVTAQMIDDATAALTDGEPARSDHVVSYGSAQTFPAWQPNTLYTTGATVRATSGNTDRYFKLYDFISSGFSGSTEPAWDPVAGSSTADNTLIWIAHYRPGLRSSLALLSELASTSLHLVADDWDGGATWYDRVAPHNNAVRVGVPTKALARQFYQRYAISAPSGAGFHAPGDDFTASTRRTYEVVIDDLGPQANEFIIGRVDGGATQYANWLYKNSIMNFESAVYNSASAAPWIGSDAYSTFAKTWYGLPVMFHIVVDAVARTLDVYLNGLKLSQDSNLLSGSLALPTGLSLGILGRWNGSAFSGATFTGSIVELARHEEAFSAATVAARVAEFNRLRGY